MVTWQRQALAQTGLQRRLESGRRLHRSWVGPCSPRGPSPLLKAGAWGLPTAPETCQFSALKTGECATKPSFKGLS